MEVKCGKNTELKLADPPEGWPLADTTTFNNARAAWPNVAPLIP